MIYIAPDFTAETTNGAISLDDWNQGSWAEFFSHISRRGLSVLMIGMLGAGPIA